MTPDGSLLALLIQQRAEAANLIVVEKSDSGPQSDRLLGTTIGQGMPKVKACPQLVEIGI
jgi:hypothetical protein